MRKTTIWMKLLMILPIVLLAVLLSWITFDRWQMNHKADSTGSTEVLSKSELSESAVPSKSEPESKSESESESELSFQEPAIETTSVVETEPEDPVVHLLFSGDILLSNHVIAAYDKAGGIHGVLDEGYRTEIGKADLFMANEEFPFSERGSAAADKQYTFRLPPYRVSIFNELGIDMVSLANNHSLDFGTDALVDTCTTLDNAGIRYVGAGPNMDRARQLEVMEVRGRRIGFLAASRVYPTADWVANSKKPGMVSGYDPAILLKEVKNAEDFCDYLVVYVHWGIERAETPEKYQRVLGKQLIDAGADLVVGSHPHVLQGIEYYNGKPIIYSLGNFIFGSSIPRTALLRVEVDLNADTASLSLVPGKSGAGFTRQLTEAGDIQEFYQYMQSISFDVSVDETGRISH